MRNAPFLIAAVVSLLCTLNAAAQIEPIPLELITAEGDTTTILIEWPSVNKSLEKQEKKVMRTVNAELESHGFDCPPERIKAGPTIWICGNGKTIHTSNQKLAEILSREWEH